MYGASVVPSGPEVINYANNPGPKSWAVTGDPFRIAGKQACHRVVDLGASAFS